MPNTSSGVTSYRIRDAYGRIYYTMTRILLDPTQEKVQYYHHRIESDESAAATSASNRSHNIFSSEMLYNKISDK